MVAGLCSGLVLSSEKDRTAHACSSMNESEILLMSLAMRSHNLENMLPLNTQEHCKFKRSSRKKNVFSCLP